MDFVYLDPFSDPFSINIINKVFSSTWNGFSIQEVELEINAHFWILWSSVQSPEPKIIANFLRKH